MRRVAHISDLHFGALRAETLEPLLDTLAELAPDVVAVSGDVTQRSRAGQFEAARDFLRKIEGSRHLVVPGNHDIPLFDLWLRFTAPLRRFARFISDDRFPSVSDEEMLVVGVNTARSTALTNGRINRQQLDEIARLFERAPPRALRVLVAHHPFVLPDGIPRDQRAGRADLALAFLVEHQVDLLLTGHRHIAWVSPLGTSLPTVHAGTATSRRTRGQENSFNDIIVDSETVTVRRFVWQAQSRQFLPTPEAERRFMRDAAGRVRWALPAKSAPAPDPVAM